MTKVKAIVLPGHSVSHVLDKQDIVSRPEDGVVEMTELAFGEAEKMGAVRRARRDDVKAEAVVPAEPAPTPETVSEEPKARGRL